MLADEVSMPSPFICELLICELGGVAPDRRFFFRECNRTISETGLMVVDVDSVAFCGPTGSEVVGAERLTCSVRSNPSDHTK